jgi:hypothetical protein
LPLSLWEFGDWLPERSPVFRLEHGLMVESANLAAERATHERGHVPQIGTGFVRPNDLVHTAFSTVARAGCAVGAILRAPSTMEIGPLRERLSKLQSRLEILRGHL